MVYHSYKPLDWFQVTAFSGSQQTFFSIRFAMGSAQSGSSPTLAKTKGVSRGDAWTFSSSCGQFLLQDVAVTVTVVVKMVKDMWRRDSCRFLCIITVQYIQGQ